jgi:hypothetical protein
LEQILGARKSGEAGGTEAYVVPLAVMRLDEIYRIETLAHGRAVVRSSWCWNPNRLGEFFDASGAHEEVHQRRARSEMIDVERWL